MPPKRQASSNVSPTLAKMEARGGRPAGPSGPSLISKLSTEFVGTALLTLTVGAAAGQGSKLAAVGIGSTLMCAVYAGAHISGANYNPAVTLAIFVRGKLGFMEAILYMLTQLFGGFAGGCAALVLEPGWVAGSSSSWWPQSASDVGIGYPAIGSGVSTYSAICAEAIVTFALCHTVLHVATNSVQDGNSYYGLAIGFIVLSGAVSVGGVSGGAFNPAVAMLSFARLVDAASLSAGPRAELSRFAEAMASSVWVHFAGPLAGGLLAGLLFRLTHPSQCGDVSAVCRVPRERLAPYVIEAVGTMLLCFTVATAAAPSNATGLAPLAIGSMLMSQVYTGGSTSGAHYNPAVTVAVMLRRALAPWETRLLVPPLVALAYICSQLCGALLGGVLGAQVVATIGFPSPPPSVSPRLACAAEALATFFLCLVVLQTATVAKLADKQYFGLAIGYTVTAMAVAVGGVSGAALNPAVGILGGLRWYYFAGPLFGAVAAALAFRVVAATEFESPDASRGMV